MDNPEPAVRTESGNGKVQIRWGRRKRDFYREPPFHQWQFWAVQASVVAIFASQELAQHLSGMHQTVVPLFVIVVAYAAPILYAALQFGLLGSVMVSALATACVGYVMGQHLAVGDTIDAWADNVQIIILDVVGSIVGHYVEAANNARQEATTFATQILGSQEEERLRISRELHDETVQLLVHLSRILESARKASPGDNPATDRIEEARKTADTVASGLRDIARGLRPAILDDLGLEAGLTRLVRELGERTAITTTFAVKGQPASLEADVELALFRITQEALTNVERHSQAREAWVTLAFSPHEVTLSVVDNGIGNSRAGSAGHRLGIIGIRERARAISGSVTIGSVNGTGTAVKVRFPLLRPG